MLYESNYLMHYRTKGSKNGVRRYQNEDGSLTAEGREHYGVGERQQARAGSQVSSNDQRQQLQDLMRGTKKGDNSSDKQNGQQKANKSGNRTKKILAAAAAVSLAAAAAYVGSKAIKKKANDLLNREYKRNVNTMANQHDRLAKNVMSANYNIDTSNAILENLRRSTNAHLDAYKAHRDSQQKKNNRSTREALRYIRGHR